MHPYDIIQKVASTAGTNDKLAILKEHESNALLQLVLKLCYDRSIMYYMTKVPPVTVPVKALNTLVYATTVLVGDIASRKVTGNAAKELLAQVLCTLSLEDQKCIELIINRDIKAGVKDKGIAKVWPNLLPFLPYMRCSTSGDNTYPAYSELKADGAFSRWVCKSGTVKGCTRNGTPLVNIPPYLYDELSTLPDGVYEGEILIKRDGVVLPRSLGNGIVNKAFIQATADLKRNEVSVIQLWDVISEFELKKGICKKPRSVRLAELEEAIGEDTAYLSVVPYMIVKDRAQALLHASQLISEGFEGTIVKNMDGIWKNGTSKDQIKFKVEEVVELRAKALIPSAEGSKNENTFGSILCESECGLLEVSLTGITDKLRAEICDNWSYYEGKVLSCKANDVTISEDPRKKHSLFLPRFVEWRDSEKSTADTFVKILEVFNVQEPYAKKEQ